MGEANSDCRPYPRIFAIELHPERMIDITFRQRKKDHLHKGKTIGGWANATAAWRNLFARFARQDDGAVRTEEPEQLSDELERRLIARELRRGRFDPL